MNIHLPVFSNRCGSDHTIRPPLIEPLERYVFVRLAVLLKFVNYFRDLGFVPVSLPRERRAYLPGLLADHGQ